MKKNNLYIIVIVVAIASIVFRLINFNKLEQSSLLFIGIPTLITVLVVKHANKPKSAYGIVFLTLTIFLLICSIFFGEGIICILMMAPLFYGVAAIIVALYLYFKNKDKNKTYSFAIIPLLLLMANPLDYIRKDEIHRIKTIKEVSAIVNLSALNKSPNFLYNLPTFFKAGFPKPIAIQGKGLAIGDIRKIAFKSSTKGVGELTLEIKEKTDTSIVFKINSDETHIDHWLTYKEVKVEIVEKEGKKMVIWTTDFICDLGPSWYFEGFEKYAISLVNEHLINAYFIEN